MARIRVIDAASAPGSPLKANEDRVVEAEGLWAVLDGATGLGEQLIASYPSDAAWFVDAFAARLIEAWKHEPRFLQSVGRAIDQCAAEYDGLIGGRARQPYERPSAGMVAIVVEDGEPYAFRLGDCTAYYKSHLESYRVFGASELERLDGRSIEAIAEHVRAGRSAQEAREAVSPMLRAHRALMNMPGGYGALALTRKCMGYIEKRRIPLGEDALVLLASDGFSAIEDYSNLAVVALFEKVAAVGVAGVIQEIRGIESGDLSLEVHPRLKPHDDSTAVLLELVR